VKMALMTEAVPDLRSGVWLGGTEGEEGSESKMVSRSTSNSLFSARETLAA
jgi:hypothetical protein